MNKIVSVSVAFPAYNEEKNIAKIIADVLSQEQKGWRLDSITLFDDGSTDRTVEFAKKAFPTINILKSKRRAGKTGAVNHILKAVKGDIVLLYDADVRRQ